jgi:hypothetical protein
MANQYAVDLQMSPELYGVLQSIIEKLKPGSENYVIGKKSPTAVQIIL